MRETVLPPSNKTERVNDVCVDLLDKVFDLAIDGKVHSVALVIVTDPGQFRIAAAGQDIDGMLAGAKAMMKQFEALLEQAKPKTVLHNQ